MSEQELLVGSGQSPPFQRFYLSLTCLQAKQEACLDLRVLVPTGLRSTLHSFGLPNSCDILSKELMKQVREELMSSHTATNHVIDGGRSVGSRQIQEPNP